VAVYLIEIDGGSPFRQKKSRTYNILYLCLKCIIAHHMYLKLVYFHVLCYVCVVRALKFLIIRYLKEKLILVIQC
jgi:hypothetical protein